MSVLSCPVVEWDIEVWRGKGSSEVMIPRNATTKRCFTCAIAHALIGKDLEALMWRVGTCSRLSKFCT